MLLRLVDHLWQSACCCALTSVLAFVVRRHSARWRLWLWRLAALKFALPFGLLFALGRSLGFPVESPGDLPPVILTNLLSIAAPVAAPVSSSQIAGFRLAAGLAVMLLAALVCLRIIFTAMLLERLRLLVECERIERDPDDAPSNPGLVSSALLSAACVLIAIAPVMAGAVDDRLHRHELMIANAVNLRSAQVVMTAAAPGMGQRTRIIVKSDGLLIRNISIQELIALAYGVGPYSVRWLDQMFPESAAPEEKYFLSLPRFDVRVTAPIRAPREFEPYSLRQTVTKLLAQRFGLQLYVKQECQPPCGQYAVPLPEVE